MRQVEYKISEVRKTETEATYIGKFCYITWVDDTDPLTGETVRRPEREKIQEFQFRFDIDKPESEIFGFIRQVGSIFGEVINE